MARGLARTTRKAGKGAEILGVVLSMDRGMEVVRGMDLRIGDDLNILDRIIFCGDIKKNYEVYINELLL